MHTLFGLTLACDPPIPGLPIVSAVSADVTIRLGAWPSWDTGREQSAAPFFVSAGRDASGEPVLSASRVADGRFIHFTAAEGAEFLIGIDGTGIWGRWREPLTLDDAASYLVGPILGLTLRLRGVTCLHASAVAIEGRAVAFAGPSGAGKSTLAASFATAGYAVLSDDLVALTPDADRYLVQPGLPWLRLREDAAALLGAAVSPAMLTATADAGYVDLDLRRPGYQHATRALPLGAVYLLSTSTGAGDEPRLEPVNPSTAVTTLAADTWATRLLDARMRAQEFDALCAIVSRAHVKRVRPAADAGGLDLLRDAICRDLSVRDHPSQRLMTAER